jgi:hypothetical protein
VSVYILVSKSDRENDKNSRLPAIEARTGDALDKDDVVSSDVIYSQDFKLQLCKPMNF